jgi:hypothetical protein
MRLYQISQLIVLFFGPGTTGGKVVEALSAPAHQLLPGARWTGILDRRPQLAVNRSLARLGIVVNHLVKFLLGQVLILPETLDRSSYSGLFGVGEGAGSVLRSPSGILLVRVFGSSIGNVGLWLFLRLLACPFWRHNRRASLILRG